MSGVRNNWRQVHGYHGVRETLSEIHSVWGLWHSYWGFSLACGTPTTVASRKAGRVTILGRETIRHWGGQHTSVCVCLKLSQMHSFMCNLQLVRSWLRSPPAVYPSCLPKHKPHMNEPPPPPPALESMPSASDFLKSHVLYVALQLLKLTYTWLWESASLAWLHDANRIHNWSLSSLSFCFHISCLFSVHPVFLPFIREMTIMTKRKERTDQWWL